MARRSARGMLMSSASMGTERISSAKSTQPCTVCNAPATLKCSGCLRVWYCCADHQKQDWRAGHKQACKTVLPVRYEKSDAPYAQYWDMCEDKEGTWRAYVPHTDGSLTIRKACCEIGNRAVMMTWRAFVQHVLKISALTLSKKETKLVEFWAYAPKRHSWSCLRGSATYLASRVIGGSFRHQGMPMIEGEDLCRRGDRAMQAIIPIESTNWARYAILDYVLNILLPPLLTVECFSETDVKALAGIPDADGINHGIPLRGKVHEWCEDLALANHVPTRCNFEGGMSSERMKKNLPFPDGKAWLAVFLKVRAAVCAELGITLYRHLPIDLAKSEPLLAAALCQSRADCPPCVAESD